MDKSNYDAYCIMVVNSDRLKRFTCAVSFFHLMRLSLESRSY